MSAPFDRYSHPTVDDEGGLIYLGTLLADLDEDELRDVVRSMPPDAVAGLAVVVADEMAVGIAGSPDSSGAGAVAASASPDPEIVDGVPWCRRECALCIPEDGLAGWRCHAAGGNRIADAIFDDSDWPVIADATFDDPEWREPCYPELDATAIRLALVRQGGGE